MTTKENSTAYFEKLADSPPKQQISSEELSKSIQEAIKEINERKNQGETKKTVKFAGETIEFVFLTFFKFIRISGSKESARSLDTLVSSISSKKSLSAIDKSSYDWDKFKDKEGIKEEVEKALKDRRIQDLRRGFTSYGIHRDDYIFEINGLSLGLFGSQGQIRTAILSLKLAEKDLFYIEKGEMPILLLDDVMSELDGYRREYLYEKLKNCQVLITCTDKLNGSDITSFEIIKEV